MTDVLVIDDASAIVIGTRSGEVVPDPKAGTHHVPYDPVVYPDPRGMKLVDGTLTAPPPSVTARRAERLRELAEYRWIKQVTFQFGDEVVPYPCDPEVIAYTQAKVKVATDAGKQPTDYIGGIKIADGRPLLAISIRTANNYLRAADVHVQGCFAIEAALAAQIVAAADVSAVDAVDITTGWPA